MLIFQMSSLKFGRQRLLLFVACLSLLIGLIGCSKKTAPAPTEAESFAMSVVNARFVERDGRWLALETIKGTTKTRLIELNKPTLQFNAGRVSETDQMNGITQRCTLSVFCEQSRYWNGTWSDWKAGTGGSKPSLVNALTNGTFGYQHYQLEKKNGEWVIKGAKPPSLSTDRVQLQRAIASALAPQQ